MPLRPPLSDFAQPHQQLRLVASGPLDGEREPAHAQRVARRSSDEVTLDIVMALLIGVPIGIALAFGVSGIGWLTGHDFSGFAGWLGVAGAVIAVGVALRRSERSSRQKRA